MVALDQKWRLALRRAVQRRDTVATRRLRRKLVDIDSRNERHLKRIIRNHGWPTISLVGEKTSHLVWLLVQHVGHDRRFQEACLSLLEKAVAKQDGLARDLAYLTDRVRIAQGKRQLFGTQLGRKADGSLFVFPIYKVKDLNKRRRSHDLEPFEEYVKKVKHT